MFDQASEEMAYYEKAGPSLLAHQDPEPKARKARPPDEWTTLWTHLETRLTSLRTWRITWWEHWALLAEYILPRRYHWLITPNTMSRGLPINNSIVDPTGSQAMRVCAAGMMSGLTSPSRPWFKLKAGMQRNGQEPDRDAQVWFDEVESRMYALMAHSNFYDSLTQHWEDLTTFGTAPIIIYEDEEDVIRCYNPCAGEYFLAVSNSMRVESLYRQYVMTISQIVEMFGLENCPSDVQELWRTKRGSIDSERIIAHAIEPNYPIDGNDIGVVKGDFAYREVYWLFGVNADQPLSIRGFKELPFISPRWATTSNDPYGRSPGMDTLPDIMQLQMETKRKAEAIEKQVRPPLLASIELKNEPSSILPGHVTYVSQLDAGKGMRPIYEVQPDLQYMTADLKEIQTRVKSGFFNDLFLLLAQQTKEMTAYEVAQRQQEKLQVLGPVIERFQNEGASPAIKRIFSIMARKNLLPPLPQSLQGVPIQIEYISMLALAQRAAATAGMERLASMVGSMAATNPNVLDLIDEDEFIREYADLLTVPHKVLQAEKAVAAIRAQRAQAQQKAQQAQEMMQTGMAAVQGAQTLSQTDVGGGVNALQMMLGNSGGGNAGASGGVSR